MILGHPDWKKATIKAFALFPEEHREEQETNLLELIRKGRVPIAARNVEFVPLEPGADRKEVINAKSADADLTILGFQAAHLKRSGAEMLSGFDNLGNVLWVTTTREIELEIAEEPTAEAAPEVEAESKTEPTDGATGMEEAAATARGAAEKQKSAGNGAENPPLPAVEAK
jgi:hypothetical protein